MAIRSAGYRANMKVSLTYLRGLEVKQLDVGSNVKNILTSSNKKTKTIFNEK
jgi:hypothetical protein